MRKGTAISKKFRSGFEAQIASQLNRVGVQFGYETIRLPYIRKCAYTPDFILANGIIVEVKGWFRPADRSKLVLVKRASPWADIRLVFQNSKNRLSKKSTTTYGDWANKNGFPYSDRSIPEKWTQISHDNRKLTQLYKRFRCRTRPAADLPEDK